MTIKACSEPTADDGHALFCALVVLHLSGQTPLYDEMKAAHEAGVLSLVELLHGLGEMVKTGFEVMDDRDRALVARYWGDAA